jgi:hypothetical protein
VATPIGPLANSSLDSACGAGAAPIGGLGRSGLIGLNVSLHP